MTWSDSAWKRRLTDRLEPILRSSNLAKEISTYQGVPFGLFAYPPSAERDVRREVRMLATRIEHETPTSMTFHCPACGNRWSAEGPRTKPH